MSNYQMSLNEQPDWAPPTDYANLEPPDDFNDEPPVNWEFPENVLTGLAVEIPNPSLEDTVPDLQTQLADLEQRLELNEANENTIERTLMDEQLHEEQEGLMAELAVATHPPDIETPGIVAAEEQAPSALPPRDALIERANQLGLYDARFMGKTDRDMQGNTIGQTIQALEVYQDTNGVLSGSVLDIGHYTNEIDAEQDYSQLQEAVLNDDVPSYAVASLGEMVAHEHGLDTVWREAAPEDLKLYQQHLEFDGVGDVPRFGADIERLATDSMAIADAERGQAALEQSELAQQQALEALLATGLQPSEDFDLSRDSYLDDESGKRYLAGIFQSDLANETAGCQATLIQLGPHPDGMGQQANVVPIGASGSYDAAYRDWSAVHLALNQSGVSGAVETVEQIEAQISAARAISDEPVRMTDISQLAAEEPDIVNAEQGMARGFDIGGM